MSPNVLDSRRVAPPSSALYADVLAKDRAGYCGSFRRNLGWFESGRQSLTAYLHAAGVEGGYGFFAPAVPDSYKVVFELHHGDGRIDYDLPRVSGRATGMRLTTLLDYIGRTQYEPLRELMLKNLAYSSTRRIPKLP